MNEQTRIFRMTNIGIFLNEKEIIPYSKTNLPKKYFKFSEEKDIFWLIKPVFATVNNRKVIEVEVLDYNVHDNNKFLNQKLKGQLLPLQFKNLDYHLFMRQVLSYTAGRINGSLFSKSSLGYKKEEQEPTQPLNRKNPSRDFLKNSLDELRKKIEEEMIKERRLEFNFKKKWDEVEIKDGYAETKYQIREIGKTVIAKVQNENLRREYDLIKNYFSNKIGKKTIDFKIIINLSGLEVKDVDATSVEIEKINNEFLDTLRQKQIYAMRSAQRSKDDKALHSIEELIKKANETDTDIFNYSINDIIQVLTNNYSHRNSKQIIYLADKHDAIKEKVWLTLKPIFGFVFFIYGEANIHFVWELLDTHATYIWSFPKSLISPENALTQVELAINKIHEIGRNKYKTQTSKQNIYPFTAIEHQANEESIDFEKWRKHLEAITKT